MGAPPEQLQLRPGQLLVPQPQLFRLHPTLSACTPGAQPSAHHNQRRYISHAVHTARTISHAVHHKRAHGHRGVRGTHELIVRGALLGHPLVPLPGGPARTAPWRPCLAAPAARAAAVARAAASAAAATAIMAQLPAGLTLAMFIWIEIRDHDFQIQELTVMTVP